MNLIYIFTLLLTVSKEKTVKVENIAREYIKADEVI
jgi:hypothetical protein